YYGIDMEIAAALAEYLGKELVIQNMKFEAVCLSVGQHQCDIAMAGLTIQEDRKEHVTFSDSYYTASQKLIVAGDNTEFDSCKTKEDVEAILNSYNKDVKIGVQTGTTGQFYVEGDSSWDPPFPGFPVICTPYDNGSLAVQDLINGGLKGVIIDSAPAKCITDSINAVN
ncbi:MAG: transporter substrate-binding domain-containing protein, partial [Clostridia bacterium]|nr:transporter substrate-binding domain-containing protein [Clostridia bacterium]